MGSGRVGLGLGRFAAAATMLLALQAPLVAQAQAPAAPQCRGNDLLPEVAAIGEAGARIDEAARAIANGEAMLWRVARPGGPASHLLGTLHLSDERVTRLPPTVSRALEGSRRLVLEVADLSPQALGTALARLREKAMFVDGRSISTMLTPAELAAAGDAVAKVGVPPELLAVARPWLVTMMMALTECERTRVAAGQLPLDLSLASKARDRGMPVAGLETIEDQLSAMAAVPEADQLTMLRATLKLADRVRTWPRPCCAGIWRGRSPRSGLCRWRCGGRPGSIRRHSPRSGASC
ncbi:MAG: TraB/GumN family protein [Hyphomicrobiaceae bacterium]|nr:TraB/GumN family protein [Hyphomicrobiaceae bacterium]